LSTQKIERVDGVPLIVHWLLKMRVPELIDAIWQPHSHWQGLSYGQLAVLLLTFIIYTHTHKLSQVEDWEREHHHTLELSTGWQIKEKDLTDDRLGRLLEVLGEDEAQSAAYQQHQSQHLIRAYALPTAVARYDTTTFNVYHEPTAESETAGLLCFGHSKDQRPDLRQYKLGVSTLDPAGIPVLAHVLDGKCADDPLYIPAWRETCATVGHCEFLFVADCKASALETRATLAAEGGHYLFPQTMTGDVPELLTAWVAEPPDAPQAIVLDAAEDPTPIGQGFVVERTLTATTETGEPQRWTERWLVTQSYAHAQREEQRLHAHLTKAEHQLQRLRAKAEETAAEFLARAQCVAQQHHVAGLFQLTVTEDITTRQRYLQRGRPGPDTPHEDVTERQLHLHVQRDTDAVAQAQQLLGWRIYVTNVPAERMSLAQATVYYRDQWLNERGYHRFKRGSLPALPLFLRIPARIKGLMLLLLVALQALTLLEFVVQRELARQEETLAGLLPGNPRMRTARPSAERLLVAFDYLHLLITTSATQCEGHLIEPLSALQHRILALLQLPEAIYQLVLSNDCAI
jgi:transposase